MRNFKKFLALVLAMLMVSACAISASAAFSDQNQINDTGYAEAVEALTSWGIINGITEGDETVFNPGGYLTRDQAAKICALLVLGKKAAAFDFDAYKGAGFFTDVVGTWGEGYVNYAAKQGYINGVGNNLYKPGDKFTYAQAAKVLAYMMGLEYDIALADQLIAPSQWYTNIMTIAEKFGVLDDIDWVGLEEAPITRAVFCQMAYNAVKADMSASYIGYNKLCKNLGILTVVGELTKIEGEKVYVDGIEGDPNYFNKTAFNAALAEAYGDLTADKLLGTIVTATYSDDKKVIYKVAISSDTVVFDSFDAFLAPVAGAGNEAKVTLNGVTYALVAEKDLADDVAALAGIGGLGTVAKNVVVTVDDTVIAKNTELPKYYSGIAYDDNCDGIFDRVALSAYKVGIITTAKKNASNVAYDFAANLNGDVEYDSGASATKAADVKKTNYTGEAFVSGVTPVIYNWSVNPVSGEIDVDVLAAAELKTGKVSELRDEDLNGTLDTIVFEGKKVKCAEFISVPTYWIVGQTVSMYVLEDLCAGIIEYDTTNVMVDNAVVSGTNAIITGYNADTYAPMTVVVNGIIENSKFYSGTAFQAQGVKKADGKTFFNGLVGFGTKTTSSSYNYLDVDGATKWVAKTIFEEGKVYTLVTTKDGTYVDLKAGEDFLTYTKAEADGKLPTNCKLKVTSSYIYAGTTPYFYNDKAVIMGISKAAKTVDGNLADDYYAQTYLYTDTYEMDKVDCLIVENKTDYVNFIWLNNIGTDTTVATQKALNSAKTFVQILDSDPIGVRLDLNVFRALDLMTGKQVEITTPEATLTAGDVYEATGSVLDSAKTIWFDTFKVEATANGLISSLKAQVTTLEKAAGEKEWTLKAGKLTTIDASKITVYTLDGDTVKYDATKGVYVTEDANKLTTGDYYGYSVAGKVIILK